jgi:hypothetical protein
VTDFRQQAALALRAAAVSGASCSWFGRRARAVPTGADPAVPARAYVVHELAGVLYRSFYTQGEPVPVAGVLQVPAPPAPEFVDELSRANAGRGRWQAGWRVADVEPFTVVRDGLHVAVSEADCRPRGAASGAGVRLRRPSEHRAATPGFYTAFGDADPAGGDLEVRVYFHLTAAGSAPLVASCTRALNDAGLPFALKVVDNPAAYARCDAGVLYLEAGDFDRAPVGAVVTACAPHLRSEVPAFAKPLAAGVAVGEHLPVLGTSFGSSRCRLLAEGIVDAHEKGARRLDARLDAVAQRFAAAGLDLEKPYLVPGSEDRYAL